MKKFLNVFQFEFYNFVKNKAFIATTLVLALIIGVVISIPTIMQVLGGESDDAGNPGENVVLPDGNAAPGEQPVESDGKSGLPIILINDLSGLDNIIMHFAAAMPDYNITATTLGEDELLEQVGEGRIKAAVIIDTPLSYRYIVNNIGMFDTRTGMIDTILQNKYRAEMIIGLGGSAQQVADIMNASVSSVTVMPEGGKNQISNFFYTYVLIFALYIAILLYGQFVASSVAIEKSSRAMELLITSADTKHLMFGKVIGTGCAGLLQFSVMILSGVGFYQLNKSAYGSNELIRSIFNMPTEILLYALLFFVLGFFIYAFMYGAFASLVSRMEQLSTAVLPCTFLFVIAFMIAMISMSSGNTDSVLMRAASFVPFTSPMAMFVRITMGEVMIWEIMVSVAILIISTAGVGYIAAGIYRIGVLLYGKPPKPGELFKMMITKK